MTDSLSITIRRQLRRYLTGDLALRDFVRWLASRMESLERHPQADDLAQEIYLRLAEYTNGDWTEEQLRAFFRPLVTTYTAIWPTNITPVQTGISNAVTPSTIRYPLAQAAGISRGGAVS